MGRKESNKNKKKSESITQSTGYPLCEACPEKNCGYIGTDRLGIRIDWDIKPQTMQKKNYRILACMHDHTNARTHAVSEIKSSTLNCRRVYVLLKKGVSDKF